MTTQKSWAHVLQTSHEIEVEFGGVHTAWMRREVQRLGPIESRDGTWFRFHFSALIQEALNRLLWRIMRISLQDAIHARQEVMGDAGGGRAR